MSIDAASAAAVIVAVVAAISAYAAQRAASKTSSRNLHINSRLDMEKEAYERARTLDLATIERQNREIKQLIEENDRCKKEIERLKLRVLRLELVVPKTMEKEFFEQFKEYDDEGEK